MDPTRPPDGEWYCYKCLAKKDPRPKALSGGVFCSLMNKIDEKNPSSYHLPYDVRDFFEGVKTGEEGEYEDSFATKVKSVPSSKLHSRRSSFADSSGPGLVLATRRSRIISNFKLVLTTQQFSVIIVESLLWVNARLSLAITATFIGTWTASIHRWLLLRGKSPTAKAKAAGCARIISTRNSKIYVG